MVMKMEIFYSSGPKDGDNGGVCSIFLAGLILRGDDKLIYSDWRKEALSLLEEKGFGWHVYVSTPMKSDYQEQIDWEAYHLEKAF